MQVLEVLGLRPEPGRSLWLLSRFLAAEAALSLCNPGQQTGRGSVCFSEHRCWSVVGSVFLGGTEGKNVRRLFKCGRPERRVQET